MNNKLRYTGIIFIDFRRVTMENRGSLYKVDGVLRPELLEIQPQNRGLHWKFDRKYENCPGFFLFFVFYEYFW